MLLLGAVEFTKNETKVSRIGLENFINSDLGCHKCKVLDFASCDSLLSNVQGCSMSGFDIERDMQREVPRFAFKANLGFFRSIDL